MPDLVNKIIAPEAFKQLDDAILKLGIATDAITKLAAEAKTIQFNFGGVKELSALSEMINKANATIERMAVVYTSVTTAQKELNAATAQFSATTQANADTLAKQKIELAYVESQLKRTQKAILEGNGNMNTNNQLLADWTRRQQELRVEIGETTQYLKTQIKENYAAANSINEARAQSSLYRKELNNLNLTTEEGVARHKQLVIQIAELDAFIEKNSDKYTQRKLNIGNYPTVGAELAAVKQQMQQLIVAGEGTGTEFQKLEARAIELSAAMREVSASTGKATFSMENITGRLEKMGFRMLLHMAIFQVVFEGARMLYEWWTKDAKAAKELEESMKKLDDTAKASAQTEIANVKLLASIAKDVNEPMAIRLRAIDDLQKKYPDYLGNLSKEAMLTGNTADAMERLNNAILNKAFAEAAISKVGEQAKQYIELNDQLDVYKTKLQDANNKFNQLNTGSTNQYAVNAKVRAALDAENAKRDIANVEKKMEAIKAVMKKYQDEANSFASLAAPLIVSQPDKAKKQKQPKDLTNETLKAEQDYTKELYGEYSKRLEIDAEYQKAIADNENNSLSERVTAYRKYAELTFMAKAEALSAEYTETELALNKIAQIEAKAADKRTNEEKDLLLRKDVLLQKQQTNIAAYGLLAVKSSDETQKAIIKIYGDEATYRITALQKIKVNNDQLMQDELDAAQQHYGNSLETEKHYQDKVKAIKLKYSLLNEQQSRDFLKEEIADLEKQGADVSKLNVALSASDDKIKRDKLDKEAQDIEKRKAALKEIKDLSIQFAQEAANAIITIQDNQFNEELSRLNDKSDSIRRLSQQEKDAIEATTKNSIDRQNKLSILAAQTAAQENTIEAQKKEIEIRKAKFDKEASIAKIIGSIASAEAQALTLLADPVTAPFYPAVAALIGFTGAAQLAAASSAPIPQYKYGIGFGNGTHPGGLFVAGDGNEPELITAPGKNPYWSADRPKLYNEAAGTTVAPLSKLIQYMNANVTQSYGYKAVAENKEVIAGIAKMDNSIKQMGEGLAYVISRSKPVVNVSNEGLIFEMRRQRK